MSKLLIVGLLGCVLLCSCDDNVPLNQWHPAVPELAINVKNVGNGWYEFTYEGKRFLYYKSGHNSTVTQIYEGKEI